VEDVMEAKAGGVLSGSSGSSEAMAVIVGDGIRGSEGSKGGWEGRQRGKRRRIGAPKDCPPKTSSKSELEDVRGGWGRRRREMWKGLSVNLVRIQHIKFIDC
jgi:hypothetical protein